MKTMGWFQNFKTLALIATVALSAGISAQSWALNIDFDKEIRKREIVSVKIAGGLSEGTEKQASSTQKPEEDLDLTPDRETETFSVQLKPISR